MKDAKEGESGAEEAKAGTESESEAKGEPKKKEPKCPMSFLNFFFYPYVGQSGRAVCTQSRFVFRHFTVNR